MKRLQTILQKLQSNLFLLILLGILGVLFYQNYTPGTWLTGWDNLHPEFNFGLNIKRAFHSVWQEYQGLGLLAGMAHAADLFREIILWIVSFVLPQSFNRYFFHFLMIASGAIGTYFFLKGIVFENKKEIRYAAASFLGALFYVFNLGTIQYFYVPFEPYSMFWGMLPWSLFTLFRYLKHNSKQNLLWFALVNILATGQAYVQTIFLVYAIVLGLVLAVYLVSIRSKKALVASLLTVGIIFVTNAFWILPQAYFVTQDIDVTQNAMQNRMATEKFYQMNKGRGNISDYVVLKEFYYDFLDTEQGQTVYMMHVWRDYVENPFVLLIGYLLFAVIIVGLLQKSPMQKYTVTLFVFSSCIFLSNTPVIEQLNSILRNLPLVNQIFRNPFTKVIVPTSFIFAVSFSMGSLYLFQILKKIRLHEYLVVALMTGLIGVFAFPSFQGEYISKRMKVSIPQQYFDLFSYLDNIDKNKRIMNLPQGSYWGWYEYEWGLRGSGFLWYGIEQPIMDRAFDVWSDELEGYYWQLADALRKENMDDLNNLIEKYDISYVLYDESLVQSDPFNPTKLAYKQKDLLAGNDKLRLVKQFGTVYLYETTLSQPSETYVSASSDLPNVQYPERYSTKDLAYKLHGPYQTDDSKPYQILYPYASLFTNRFADDSPFMIEESPNSYLITAEIRPGEYDLHNPLFGGSNQLLPVKVYAQRQQDSVIISVQTDLPTILLENEKIDTKLFQKQYEFTVPDGQQILVSINDQEAFDIPNDIIESSFIGNALLHTDTLANTLRVYSLTQGSAIPLAVNNFAPSHVCGPVRGDVVNKADIYNDSVTLSAQNTSICQVYAQSITFDKPALVNVRLEYKSETDEFPTFCFYSEATKSCRNHKDNMKFGFSDTEYKEYSDYFEFYPNEADTIFPQLVLEALRDEDRDLVKKISYKNIRLISYPLLEETTIDFTQQLAETAHTSRIQVKTPIRMTVEVSKNSGYYSYENLLSQHLYKKSAFNYDAFLDGSYDLEVTETEDSTSITLSSQRASSYLLLQGPDLPLQYGYLISVANTVDAGQPLTLNIFSNKGIRNYTYTHYSKTDPADKAFYILPPAYPFDTGISALMGTTSYTDDPSINTISDFDIYPIPYDFLTNIHLTKAGSPDVKTDADLPIKTEKNAYYSYNVSVSEDTQYIEFSQSYHPGWVAYEVCRGTAVSCQLQRNFPMFFGQKLHHVTVNGWANGWSIPSDNPAEITILFWPQYLQYIGFAILLLALPITVLFGIRRRHPERNTV